MSRSGWSPAFDDPIALPDGRVLRTLRDAGNYIAKLPKRQHSGPEWQAAMHALMLVVENGGPTVFARVGVIAAPNHGHPGAVFNEDQPGLCIVALLDRGCVHDRSLRERRR